MWIIFAILAAIMLGSAANELKHSHGSFTESVLIQLIICIWFFIALTLSI